MRSAAGDTALLRVLGAGQHVGALAVVAPAPRSATIVCLDVVETLALHCDVLEQLRLEHPAVEGVLTHALVAEVRRVSSLLIEALYLPVDCRVWRRVAELADLYGPAVDGAVLIPLTQDDVAHLAGTTRPSANKVLRAGEERGVLRIGRGRIEVLDVDAIAHLAREVRLAQADASSDHRVGTVSVCADGFPPSWSSPSSSCLRAVPHRDRGTRMRRRPTTPR